MPSKLRAKRQRLWRQVRDAVWRALAPALRDNLPLERVFREAESADATQRAALQGRDRLAASAAAMLQQGVAQGVFSTDHPALDARFIITLFDNVLYEALAYDDTDRTGEVAAAGLRFVLRALGVSAARADALARRFDPIPAPDSPTPPEPS